MGLLLLVCKFLKVILITIGRMVLSEYIHALTAGSGRHSRPNFVLNLSSKMSPVACELTLSNPSAFSSGEEQTPLAYWRGDAPDFVEVGEAGVAVRDAMRHQRCVQLVG